MTEPAIRPETAGDEAEIRAVTEAAFATAPHADGDEAEIVERLRAGRDLALSLVATQDGRIVGHVAFSPVQIDGVHDDWYGLGPVSVLPARQRRGIGSSLIRDGLSRLSHGGAKGCVLVGDPDYYGRFGFASNGRLTCGGIDPRYLQRLVLVPPDRQGVVRFSPAFGLD